MEVPNAIDPLYKILITDDAFPEAVMAAAIQAMNGVCFCTNAPP